MKYIILLFVIVSSTASTLAQNMDFVISHIASSEGMIRIAIFQNQKELDDDKPFKKLSFSKKEMVNGQLKVKLDLPDNTYGISVLDDVNLNAKMDYNMIGIPKEGYGFSNFYHTGFSFPKLTDFSFNSAVDKTVKCKMKYF